MPFGIPDRERQNQPCEQVDARPMMRFIDRILYAIDRFDQIVVASLRAMAQAFVDGSAAYGLSMGGFDPRLLPSQSATSSGTEAIDSERLQFDTSYESVDDLIKAIRLKVGTDLQQRG
jgi:hypothetical protein